MSLLFGLAAAGLFSAGDPAMNVVGGLIFFISYLLDNCDGEIARARDETSRFGEALDTFVDWIVHAAFFTGLGWGTADKFGCIVWFWLGLAAALGATINYFLALKTFLANEIDSEEESPEQYDHPETVLDHIIFAFRELARADFWLLVLTLAIFDILWILLPLAAVGAQAYWILYFFARNKNFGV